MGLFTHVLPLISNGLGSAARSLQRFWADGQPGLEDYKSGLPIVWAISITFVFVLPTVIVFLTGW